ncbi:MAG: sulfatase-like hydrolase/transferase [Bryobacteraceae bacterium]|jgi:arylsulfatase A-like enzyme
MRLLATLAPLSALCGILTAFVFRRFAPRHTGRTVNRILAHVMQLRLFLDEPRLVWNAQRDLLRENLRLLGQIAVPSLIAAPLLALVMWQADAVYGRAPLRAGEAVVVTAHVKSGNLTDVRMEAPAGVKVETPGVRIPRLHEVSWRIRPLRAFSGRLLVNAEVEQIDIPWPRATVLGVSWLVWFFGISALSAVVAQRILRRPAPILAIAAILASAHSAGAAEKTPVVLISIDTLRADHLSTYGYTKIRTPNIDSFGDQGTIYLRIDSQIPLTMPSHTSLMTSTYPFENRVEENSESVPSGAVTLASVLHANGYRTAAFIGSIILDRRYGLDKGFDLYDSPFELASGERPNPYSARVRRDAALVTRAARQWIGENRGQPVFVFFHLYDLHTPYTQVGGLTPAVAGYDAEIEYVDRVLGRLRDALAHDGFWDKALVVLLADHGEGLGDHGETSHGYFIYESTMHVPLIIHWPAGAPKYPKRVAEAGGLIDVAPTILDYLHIAAPPSFEGVSLLSEHGEPMIYGESVYPQETFGWAALRSLQLGEYKYIDAPKAELYDLPKDPGERVNILPAHPAEARSMKARLDALMARYAPKPQPSSEISEHTRELLGSLGYTAPGRQAARNRAADPKDKLAEEEAYERGLTFLYSGRYGQAILALRRIVTEDARNLPALAALGEAYLRSGNAARALELWQQALERDPQYRPAADSIGEYWLARKDYDKACRFVPTAPQCTAQH